MSLTPGWARTDAAAPSCCAGACLLGPPLQQPRVQCSLSPCTTPVTSSLCTRMFVRRSVLCLFDLCLHPLTAICSIHSQFSRFNLASLQNTASWPFASHRDTASLAVRDPTLHAPIQWQARPMRQLPDAMAAAQCICSLIVLLAASQQLLPSSGNFVAAANLLNPTDPAARGWRTAGTDTEPLAPPKFPWWDPSLPFDHRIDLLVAAMNITEKISQLVKCVLGCTGGCWEYCAGGRGEGAATGSIQRLPSLDDIWVFSGASARISGIGCVFTADNGCPYMHHLRPGIALRFPVWAFRPMRGTKKLHMERRPRVTTQSFLLHIFAIHKPPMACVCSITEIQQKAI